MRIYVRGGNFCINGYANMAACTNLCERIWRADRGKLDAHVVQVHVIACGCPNICVSELNTCPYVQNHDMCVRAQVCVGLRVQV